MADWVRVAHIGELESEGLGKSFTAGGLKLALFRWEDQVYAVEDICPHLGFPLSEGIVQFGQVICSWHGWRVRLEDGSCQRERERAKIFPCEVRGEDVYVQV